MNRLQADANAAVIAQRLASARHRELVREAKRGRRPAPPFVRTTRLRRTRLEALLDLTAERVVESGTRTESSTLCAMSAATWHLCPGAAAALVDWDGSEAARLRAFGIVHGVILRDLPRRERARLLARLTDERDLAAVEDPCVGSTARATEACADESHAEAA